jgi:hypothetical protein
LLQVVAELLINSSMIIAVFTRFPVVLGIFLLHGNSLQINSLTISRRNAMSAEVNTGPTSGRLFIAP